MSTDIDIYEDDAIHISATCGGWGVRINIARVEIGPTGKRQLLNIEYGGDLLSLDRVNEMVESLRKIMPHTCDWDGDSYQDPDDHTSCDNPADHEVPRLPPERVKEIVDSIARYW